MAPLPTVIPPTVRAIYRAYEAANKHYDPLGISVGEIGTECDRALWLGFRWAARPEEIDGRKISIFRTGDAWEERMVDELREVGVEVWGQQDRIRLVHGFVRGKCDGHGLGLLEAPKTEHLLEFKSSNAKGFKEITKKGCKVAKPLHYAQCQIGMHAFGHTRCWYEVRNKDDDSIYAERIEYDVAFCLRQLARAERIIFSDEPPSRISESPEFFGCMFCRQKDVCFNEEKPRRTCRSCIHFQPERGGDCHVSCGRWAKPLSLAEQKAACPSYLTLPGLVDGEVIDSDEEQESITYRMRNGSIWTDQPTASE